MALAIPPEVAEHLGYYVYLYVDPRDDKPFYVGKGRGRRVLAHLSTRGESRKARVLEELREAGLEPQLDILARELADEETALRIEAAVIDLLGLDNLTNLVRGSQSIKLGRVPLQELITQYMARPVWDIEEPVLLIRINQRYRPRMSPEALNEATRGIWKLGPRREGAKYAFAVFEGVVREVYEIGEWHPAGTLEYKTRTVGSKEGRWEFDGCVAPEAIRARYLGSSVNTYLAKHSQYPIKYVNC